MWITTAALYLAIVVAVTSAQPAEEDADCGNLGFQRRGRFRADLPVCGRSEDQCCSAEYLEDVQERLGERLQRFLRREFDEVVEEYQDEVDNLLVYFDRYFPRKLLQNLPSFETFADNPVLRRILARLIDNLEIDEDDDEFDVGDFLETLLESITRIGARLIGGDGGRVQCIAEVLEGLVDRDAVSNLRGLLRLVRRGITALMQTGRFLEGQRNGLWEGGARMLERCVARFTEIAFCSRCTRRTPPLCFKTCDALVRGCYSPYYTAFNRRYSRLWDKIQEIVEVLNATVEAVGEIELINFREVLREVREECGVSPSDNNRRKRQGRRGDGTKDSTMTTSRSNTNTDTGSGSGEEDTTTKGRSTSRGTKTDKSTGDSSSAAVLDIADDIEFIPRALVEDIFELNGAFEYGRGGRNLRFCSDALLDDEDEDDDYESCPPPGQELKRCRVNDICTSKCYCTDGLKNITRDNETDLVFDSSDVEDQGDNPVLGISLEELMDEVNRIEGLEDPVASFLSSDEFRSVDPSVEEERVDGDGGGGSSAAGLGASLCALLLAVTALTLLS